MDASILLWGLLFGSVGVGLFVYGKRQQKLIPLVCGILLSIIPYFISSTGLLIFLGVVLLLIPFFIRY